MSTLSILFTTSQIVVFILLLSILESNRMREIHYKRVNGKEKQ
jgi:hypothetical protein